jgi:ubiquitin-protein ligase
MAIAREAQLMFTYAEGFKPIGNELNRWTGDILLTTPNGERKVTVELLVPLKYPEYPPKVLVLDKSIQHPNIEKNGNVLLNITHEWKPDIHVYQIVHALQALFKKVPPRFTDEGVSRPTAVKAIVQPKNNDITESQQKVDDVNQTITALQEKISQRDEQLRKLRSELVRSPEASSKDEDIDSLLSLDGRKNQKQILQATNVALADLLSTLDEKFKDGEISPVDFAKLYRKYTKEFYMVNKQLEEI